LIGRTGRVLSVAVVGLPGGRTVLASGSDDGSVRLWWLTARESQRRASALAPSSSRLKRVLGAPPTLRMVLVPEMGSEHVATLTAAPNGWAMLTADGCAYKVGGDAVDLLWWVIKTVRFEVGELDPYDQTIRRLDHDAAII
jgi:hypothetical protein